MNYWWVNHKLTFRKEINGGYIWSPRKNQNDSFNQTYLNLTRVKAGDIIFSFANSSLKAVGVAQNSYIDAETPEEFGHTGLQWGKRGYLVVVSWVKLHKPLRPKTIIHDIKHLLPKKYSPIQENGNGNQKCYLAEISFDLSSYLLKTILNLNKDILDSIFDLANIILDNVEQEQISQQEITEYEKLQLIKARTGQGLFRDNVLQIEKHCRVTGLSDTRFLVAGHIKPWRHSSNEEKVDGNNGLMLSPHIDRLFDQGWISFSDFGEVIIAEESIKKILEQWGLKLGNVGKFSKPQCTFLDYHRTNIFRKNKPIITPDGVIKPT